MHVLQGVISVKTLTELERMRRGGVKLVLITGQKVQLMIVVLQLDLQLLYTRGQVREKSHCADHRGSSALGCNTGARLSTMLTRMAFLPAADAYVCENGGRIYYPEATLTVALPIAEDMEWRRKHNATGVNHTVQLFGSTCDVSVLAGTSSASMHLL